MRMRRTSVLATLPLYAALVAAPVSAADHRDAPLLQLDTRADLTDAYAFQSPATPSNTVFVVATNPAAGILSPDTFTAGVSYTVEVYNDDDVKPDVRFTVKFGKPGAGGQGVKVKSKGAPATFQAQGLVGDELDLGGGGRFTAGLFDDPFFFDVVAFETGHLPHATGTDFYAGTNVDAFVIEVPTNALTRPPATVIATRVLAKKGAIDTMGRPLVSRLLVPVGQRDLFNRTKLAKQDVFLPIVMQTLASYYPSTQAATLADFFIPDVLPLDTAQPTGFFNGRKLDDDVADAMLALVTDGAITGDGVDANDAAFRTEFPYLADPH
jgi:hypothetical protein